MISQALIPRLSGNVFPVIPDPHAAVQLALQFQLESSQWWPAEKLREHQFRQLQPLLAHAFAHVPYYRDLFGKQGLTIPGQITQDFFDKIPALTRAALQHAGQSIESERVPSEHGMPRFSTTSGSTGRPVRFGQTAVTHVFWLAFGLRDHLWHERDFSGKLSSIRWFPKGQAEPPQGVHKHTWGSIVAPLFLSGPSAALNVQATLEQQLDWLEREAPDYLLSLPSNLVALTNYAREHGIALPPVREIRTIGETLLPQARTLIAEAWRAKVVDVYSCEEAGSLALQCPETEHYHVQAENVLLEIVDEAGQACPPGETGQVLITTLHNYATPLIRYEVGDMAEFGEPCACGRGLPVIRTIHGRKRNRLLLPSGESLFPYLGEHGQIQSVTGVKLHQFQCVQHSLEEVELKLVMERLLTEPEQGKVAELMQHNLGYPFRVRFSFPETIPRGPRGKFEEFVSLLTS